ncbi:hypothetical protein [Phenylobacterium aquaticum]|uniref:hypothetical protein n=1 Tax=Phenylobacterium aquaticum TaxID=1763816 RepID=UPI0026F26D6D|nr:hypothetical protein [Phenylobacterium aquaticum]
MAQGRGKVSVRFVRGLDVYSTFPKAAEHAGLTHRFAVIQDTYVPGAGEMVFDEALWMTLAAFVQGYVPGAEITVAYDLRKPVEHPLDDYMAGWAEADPEDRDPPQAFFVRTMGRLVLCLVTDAWHRVGGPSPYHDSYTYSLFADVDLGPEIQRVLANAPGAAGWDIGLGVEAAPTTRAADLRLRNLEKYGYAAAVVFIAVAVFDVTSASGKLSVWGLFVGLALAIAIPTIALTLRRIWRRR